MESLFLFWGGEGLVREKKAEIMDENAMRRAVNRISFEIIEHNHGVKNLMLAGILTRGQFLAQRIADKIQEVENVRLEVCTLDISHFRDDVPVVRRSEADLPEISDITEKTVILVDDVLYTGRTVRAAIELISQVGRAKKIQLAVLVDRGHREVPIRPDYVGKNLPTSVEETVKVMMRESDGSDAVLIMEKKPSEE
jgi:pyrimidine operon attenuation protein/uracil phosphoribosyltransferase